MRKLKKYSDGFNEKFLFFLKSYRCGILTFCGEDVRCKQLKKGDVNPNGIISPSSKEGFRLYDDGYFKTRELSSYQPRILECVIKSKKSWGLWVNQWSDGIAEGSFTVDEIVNEFELRGIKIPDSFMKDFLNAISRKKFGSN